MTQGSLPEPQIHLANLACIACGYAWESAFESDAANVSCPSCFEDVGVPSLRKPFPSGMCTRCRKPFDEDGHRFGAGGNVKCLNQAA
jgi:hypothetical protein